MTGRDAPGREAAGGTAEVVREYRETAGAGRARFTVSLPQGNVSGADPQVWAQPEAYGLERVFCPGHGSSDVCPYGAHDEIRLAKRELLRMAGRDAEREAG